MKTKFLVLVFAIGMVATACSGSGDADSGVATLESNDALETDGIAAAEPAVDVDAEQAMLDFAACMRDNGVEIEDPTVDVDGNVQFGGLRGGAAAGVEFDREAMEAAMSACQTELEGVALGFGGRGDFDLTTMQDTFVEYAACMRENGYEMDDPDLSDFGPGNGEPEPGQGGGIFGEIDREDPDFIAAQDACEVILTGAFGDNPIPGTGAGRGGGGNG